MADYDLRKPGPYERTSYFITLPERSTSYGLIIKRLPGWDRDTLCIHCDLPSVCVVDSDPVCMGHYLKRTGNPPMRVERNEDGEQLDGSFLPVEPIENEH